MSIRVFIASVFLLVVATAAQAVDLSGTWVGTNQTEVPWCPPITTSTGYAKVVITQVGDTISGTYETEANNPDNCVPDTGLTSFTFGVAGTVDGVSFQAEMTWTGIDDDDGSTVFVTGAMNGALGEDGVMSFTATIPTVPGHDHYPEFPFDSIRTAQLRRVPPYVSVNSLWPPNHKMVDIGLVIDASSTFVVYSDEDDGATPDATGLLLLRAERAGTGDGRVYLIAVTAPDGSATACLTAVVPKSQSAKDLAAVNEQAAAAMAQCPSPAGYFVIGN